MQMFIHSHITEEVAAKHNSDAAHFVIYISRNSNTNFNYSSFCVWMVPGTEIND